MIKRLLDLVFSGIALIIFSPIFIVTLVAVWLIDFKNPFYIPYRMGKNIKPFKMYKFRSMTINADKNGVSSTSANDTRITSVGKIIRKFKLDELSQLINVFIGNMSLVGPRPQVVDHVLECYTNDEMHLLDVKPGITDISSIVFSDEGDILKDSINPDEDYNKVIRPWKSKLGLFYIQHQSLVLDFKLIYLTVVAIFNKSFALKSINKLLISLGAGPEIIEVCKREKSMYSYKSATF